MFQPPGTLPNTTARPSILLYVATAVMGGLYPAGAGFLPGISSGDQAMFVVYGVVMLAMGGVFAIVYGAAPFLPKKRWAWFYHKVLICIGVTSCCCMPFCIPLLIYWIKPEAKSMFDVP